MKIINFFKTHLSFVTEHWPLVLGIVLLGLLFSWLNHFAEFAYGAMRLGIVFLVAFLVVHGVFKETLRPYIFSGQLVKDFNGLAPTPRLLVALGVIFLVVYVALQCFVHP